MKQVFNYLYRIIKVVYCIRFSPNDIIDQIVWLLERTRGITSVQSDNYMKATAGALILLQLVPLSAVDFLSQRQPQINSLFRNC